MSSRSSVVQDMVGGTPEIEAQINSRPCIALLDTGSQITTISVSFYNSHLSDIAIQNCSDLIRIEGVGGDVLPYHGFLVCDIQIPLTGTHSSAVLFRSLSLGIQGIIWKFHV